MRIQEKLKSFLKLVAYSVVVSISSVFLTTGCQNDQPKDPLTVEEREWLTGHDGKIVLAHDPDAKPIDYLDDKDRFRGLAADYVHLIEKKLNFEFNIPRVKTWAEVLKKAKNKEIDVLCAITETPEREKWLLFTKPYIIIPTVILVRETIKESLTPDKMKGMKVTFTKGWVIDGYLRENYGYLDFDPSVDEQTAMNKVSLGEAEAWVTALTTSSILIEKHKITNLRVAGEMDLQFKLAIASRKDWPILNQILQKGLSLINEEERSVIFKKWIHIEGTSQISRNVWLGLIITAAAILLLIIATILWNRTLRLRVAKKTIELRDELDERRLAEEALRESEEKLKAIFEAANSVSFITTDLGTEIGNDTRITSFSPGAEKMFGYREEEVIGKRVAILHVEEDVETFPEIIDLVKKGKKGYSGETTLVRRSGDHFPVLFTVHALFDSNGEISGTLGVSVDISERRRLETQLQQAQKMEAVGTLAGGIAHDFNNLLMAIQGRTSIMLTKKDSSHPDIKHLKGIEDNVESAADLTRQLLGFARGGKYAVKPTDLNELVKKENRMFGRTKKQISIRGKYEKDLWSVEVDQGQIAQVLLNLYVNAWQAMPAGGDLYLETENVTLDENYVKPFSIEPGKYVKISVTDTGTGMDKATREKIFEPFFTTKEMGRGTGLGLASAYGIIKNHGGFIDVYSEKGHGTTFNIYLPASEKEIIEEKKPAGDTLRGSETVLFVDDEDMIIEVAEEMFEQLGYKLLIARSGKEAIETYEKNKEQIDIVLLDMIMPDMSGSDTYESLKEIDPDIKVLLASGYSIDGLATEIMDRGCNGFIQKPFKMKELSQKLREILD